eukprot:6139806-Pyramimonas_sp.AAC.1
MESSRLPPPLLQRAQHRVGLPWWRAGLQLARPCQAAPWTSAVPCPHRCRLPAQAWPLSRPVA